MTKRNFKYKIDTIFWWLVYTIPFFVFICAMISYILLCGNANGWELNGSIDWFPEDLAQSGVSTSGSGFITGYYNNVIFDNIVDFIFVGVQGVTVFFDAMFPLFDTPVYVAFEQVWDLLLPDSTGEFMRFICGSLAWFVYAHIIHLFVDFVVFIPRLAHKWLGKAYQDD